jgi:hypothetical protein
MSTTLDTWSPAMTTTSSLQRSKGFLRDLEPRT